MKDNTWNGFKKDIEIINSKMIEGQTPFWVAKYNWEKPNDGDRNVLCKISKIKIDDDRMSIEWSENVKGMPNILVGNTYANDYYYYDIVSEIIQKISFIKE